jgi:L-asparaginase/Glu-tRNA(Gln) amidotransferase subunit D
VFVVTTTRAGSGRIAARLRPANATPAAGPNPRERAIAGEDLAPIKARLLLMLALTKTQSGADIQRMFIEY